jgi:hypothetical protein
MDRVWTVEVSTEHDKNILFPIYVFKTIVQILQEDSELEDLDDDVRESLSNLGKLYTTLWSYRESLPISFVRMLPQKVLNDTVDFFKQLDRNRLRSHKASFIESDAEYSKNMAYRAAWYKIMGASDQDLSDEELEQLLQSIGETPAAFYDAATRKNYGCMRRLLGNEFLARLGWKPRNASFWSPVRIIAGICAGKKHISWVAADVVRRSILIACVSKNPPKTARLTDRTVRFADEELSDVLGDNLQPKKLFS